MKPTLALWKRISTFLLTTSVQHATFDWDCRVTAANLPWQNRVVHEAPEPRTRNCRRRSVPFPIPTLLKTNRDGWKTVKCYKTRKFSHFRHSCVDALGIACVFPGGALVSWSSSPVSRCGDWLARPRCNAVAGPCSVTMAIKSSPKIKNEMSYCCL